METDYEYLMDDEVLYLIHCFQDVFCLNVEYFRKKSRFMTYSLCMRVKYPLLNKIFHMIINVFEEELFSKYVGYDLEDWFYDRVQFVVLLFLVSGRDFTILLLSKDGWTDKIFSYGVVENFVISSERVPEKCGTLFKINMILEE